MRHAPAAQITHVRKKYEENGVSLFIVKRIKQNEGTSAKPASISAADIFCVKMSGIDVI